MVVRHVLRDIHEKGLDHTKGHVQLDKDGTLRATSRDDLDAYVTERSKKEPELPAMVEAAVERKEPTVGPKPVEQAPERRGRFKKKEPVAEQVIQPPSIVEEAKLEEPRADEARADAPPAGE